MAMNTNINNSNMNNSITNNNKPVVWRLAAAPLGAHAGPPPRKIRQRGG